MAAFLPGYEVQPDVDGVAHSLLKLEESAISIVSETSCSVTPQLAPSTADETLAYRCSVGFQIIREDLIPATTADGAVASTSSPSTSPSTSSSPSSPSSPLVYCMRHNFKPVSINSPSFPIANARIQQAMESTITFLNTLPADSPFVTHLTSCKFISSWDEASCFLTLSYSDAPSEPELWTSSASDLHALNDLTSITARFKKTKLSFPQDLPPFVNDTITVRGAQITYRKPEDAFQHPNPTTMHKALSWLLETMTKIHASGATNGEPPVPLSLLEMYCGCGAHTIPLAKALPQSLYHHILAIELDQRLVDCCQHNIALNGLSHFVSCEKGDAGKIARHLMRSQTKPETTTDADNAIDAAPPPFDVLLVDPPRQGLDEQVIKLATTSNIKNLLYVSCGRHALKRDLALLDKVFEIVDILLTDLFPRTDSVETLTHLRRRKAKL